MVVEPRRKEGPKPQQSRKALFISLGLHFVVFLLVIFGLPHFQTETKIVDPVPVELIANVGELTTSNKPPVVAPPKPEKKEEPPKKTEEVKKPPEPKKDIPKPPAEEELKEPPKPDKKPEKPPEEKAEQKVEKKKPEPKKDPPKKEEAKESFDSLLKDLTPEEKQQPETEDIDKKATDPTPAPNVSKFSEVLSISEMDALRQQLSQCWSVMAGAANSEDLVVALKVVVNQDKTVASTKVVDDFKYSSNPFFRAAADSAMRAMRNPKCSPLHVPDGKYDQWHEMTIVFDPKEMF
jgi:outer membrane biosynthesis protein TonB